jgi:putative transposase
MPAPDGFLDYLKICSDIFTQHVEWSFQNKSTNKVQAHKDLYQVIRTQYHDIPSNILQATRDQALEAVRRLKFKIKPKKKPHSAVRYDARTIALRGNLLTFSWSGKRIKTLINLPTYFQKYQGWRMQSGTIGYDKQKKKLKISLCFQAPDILPNNGSRIVGIDRGLYNIVSLSDGQLYNANKIREAKRKFLYVKRQLQAKGTKSAKRKLKKRSGKEKRFSLYINHCISKWLAHLPYDVFVLEDLSGIRKQRKGKLINNWLSNWTFFQLETFLTYKASELGKQVVKVDARYTSQKCFGCGKIEKKNRDKSKYTCSCGYSEHADINAAKNIMSNYLLSLAEKNKEQAVVNQPNVSAAMLDTSPCL